MILSSLRFGLNLAPFPKNRPSFDYSDWQDIQAPRRVITEVIAIALIAVFGFWKELMEIPSS
jgi:hypothetical protein